MAQEKPRLAILGSGPVGLEAALAAAERAYPFTVYEAASEVAGGVASWGHVRLFTPWEMNASERMRRVLENAAQPPPSNGTCPTGYELVEHLLRPIAELPQLRDHLRLGVRVVSVGRRGLLKHEEIGTAERATRPFRLLLRDDTGHEWLEQAEVVLDCTGCTEPNYLGDGGIPAPGEIRNGDKICRDIPDIERQADDWAGKTILLIGSGHSAQTAVRDLVRLAESRTGTRLIWALRGYSPPPTIPDDPLPERAALVETAARLTIDPPPCLEIRRAVVIESLDRNDDGRIEVSLRHGGGEIERMAVDCILALTGRVGDHKVYRQLQIHECYATSGPMKLAAALLSSGATSGGDCLDQTSQGADTLKNPEPGFFLLGSKSYGRRNDFLMRVGWQQVEEVFQLLEGID